MERKNAAQMEAYQKISSTLKVEKKMAEGTLVHIRSSKRGL